MADPIASLQPRQIDRNWYYSGQVRQSVTGFNPTSSKIFYDQRSALADWLPNQQKSARLFNERDHLVREVLYSIHDYLHIWAYHAIASLRPQLKLGWGKITDETLEDFAFAHLLTEAVATAGLDYWYLSTVNLNEVCPVGTRLKNLTVSYREEDLREYQRFNPRLIVQEPDFFEALSLFYCSGILDGFAIGDLGRSPMLLHWVEHEIRYGARQRKYIRMWLRYLGGAQATPLRKLDAPVQIDKKWQRELIRQLGQLLWEKVKEDRLHTFGTGWNARATWRAPEGSPFDFRFVNYHSLSPADLRRLDRGEFVPQSFPFLFRQLVSGHDWASFNRANLPLMKKIQKGQDYHAALQFLSGLPTLHKKQESTRELFTLN